MAEHITLDTLMQSSGHTALQVQEPASVEAVRAQVEELSPEQRVRVEEVKNSIDLMDSQAALQYLSLIHSFGSVPLLNIHFRALSVMPRTTFSERSTE